MSILGFVSGFCSKGQMHCGKLQSGGNILSTGKLISKEGGAQKHPPEINPVLERVCNTHNSSRNVRFSFWI